MRITIIRPDGDLKREVWYFEILVEFISLAIEIEFEEYAQQERRTKRCRNWEIRKSWKRLEGKGYWNRYTWLDTAPLPPDIETEMRTRFQQEIAKTPITR